MDDLEAIKARLAAATPGPWYDHNPDDDMYMNAHVVTNSPTDDPDVGRDERTNDHKRIVAITLLQAPRVVCHEDGKWEENARFIAHAPADIAFLLDQLAAAQADIARKDAALKQIAAGNPGSPHWLTDVDMANIARAALKGSSNG